MMDGNITCSLQALYIKIQMWKVAESLFSSPLYLHQPGARVKISGTGTRVFGSPVKEQGERCGSRGTLCKSTTAKYNKYSKVLSRGWFWDEGVPLCPSAVP